MIRDPNFYASGGFDRAGLKRKDKAWVEAQLNDPMSRFVPVWRTQSVVFAGVGAPPHGGFFSRAQLPAGLIQPEVEGWVLLGLVDGIAYFAVDFSAFEKPLELLRSEVPLELSDLRRVGPLLGRQEGSLLAYARGILYWHSRHGFCGVCGMKTMSEEAGHVRRCINKECATQHFPRTDPAVIMLVHDGDRCLLGRQKIWAKGMHSTLAGFVEPGESLEDAVEREVFEEVGVKVTDVAYHSSQPWPFPASLMLGFHARALTTEINCDPGEIESAVWCTRDFLKEHMQSGSRDFWVPPSIAVARRLIDDWMAGNV